jgi:copper resistance protein B
MSGRTISGTLRAFVQAMLLLVALPVFAQHQHAGHEDMAGMDMPAPAASVAPPTSTSMEGMDMPAAAASTSPTAMPMEMHDDASSSAMAGMHDHAMPTMSAPAQNDHASAGAMSMQPMQGGRAPPGARSPDYSDGVAPSRMPGMDMKHDASFGLLQFDQLESFAGRDEHGQRWELQGWYGNDDDKLLLRSEGERSDGRIGEGDVEALWSHAVATYWDTTLGARHDLGDGPRRDWLAVGVQGLAPYWFELQATAYVGSADRTAFRLRADYDVLFTQRLILQPELEANLYGRDDRARDIGRGLSDMQLGLRLRYEIRREIAPYVGVQFVHRFGRSADFARSSGGAATDRQLVVGLRLWF